MTDTYDINFGLTFIQGKYLCEGKERNTERKEKKNHKQSLTRGGFSLRTKSKVDKAHRQNVLNDLVIFSNHVLFIL